MSTRSTTHFIDSSFIDPTTNKPQVCAIVYRHSDGYPKGAGVDLYKFLHACKKLKDTRLNDCNFLAARYIVFLGEMFNKSYVYATKTTTKGEWKTNKSRLDFISVGVMMQDPWDIEYRYTIDCGTINTKGLPEVRCYKVSIGDNGEDTSCVEVHIPGAPKMIMTESKLPKVLIPSHSTILPDAAHYMNRFTVASQTKAASREYIGQHYIIGQHKTNLNWQCSCMAHRVHGRCKHVEGLRLPSNTAVELVQVVNV